MSKMEDVLEAVLVLVRDSGTSAIVDRNVDKPERVGSEGVIIIRDGDPGEPEVDLNPPTYNYEHRIPLEVGYVPNPNVKLGEARDFILSPIGIAVAADRTLGGLCMYLEVVAPVTHELNEFGTASGQWADASIIAHYATTDPFN